MTRTLVVVGHGMAGHRLAEQVRAGDPAGAWRVVVLGEEPRPAYNRTALSAWLETTRPGAGAERLALVRPGFLADPLVDLRTATRVTALDRAARTVTCADGTQVRYDALVLATGSRPFVPPVPGHDLPGCHVYRTVDDLERIRAEAVAGRPGAVIGGGLLGLEAANALRLLGLRPHVVELAERLMPLQMDEVGGRVLARLVARRGLHAHCGVALRSVAAGPDGRVRAVHLADGTVVDADLVIFSAGIRPRDDLAGPAGLARGPRGGFLVDRHCRTADPFIWAVGECAALEGHCHGLAAPAHRMAETVAAQLLGTGSEPFPGADTAARLKLLGVDVASFGDAHARTPGALELAYTDHAADTYAKLVLSQDARVLLGGVLAGDAGAFPVLRSAVGRELTAAPEELLAGGGP
ncbi:NAD(P)/FAD-dependent oxidoreductase [Streptomyces johnsoniae]|uniref:FAD-dependent oxidoreductase n=1 Tax=Streptomyces johnsoniae TaxID=3075532 RepID=A0ABU2S4J3_9ACTN|nr:FAD-dependent oxidoreductase [Streptomyces sp. DSM 41886]MDT0442545.1 FAD-dependent oxidoreductase [Streptomyces sp. DSM 41886]